MSSLLVTLFAIVLVGALALATVYLGGPVYTKARVAADATAIINQGQQVSAAVTMHKQQLHSGVNDLNELVASKYLSAVPSSAWNSTGGYAISPLDDRAICLEANKKLNVVGIPNCADPRVANSSLCCTTDEAEVTTQPDPATGS